MMNLAKFYARRRLDGGSYEFSDDSESIYRTSSTLGESTSSIISSEEAVEKRSNFLSTSNESVSTLPELIIEPYKRKIPDFLENLYPEYIRETYSHAKRMKMDEENCDMEVYAFCEKGEDEKPYRYCGDCTDLKRKERRSLFVKNFSLNNTM